MKKNEKRAILILAIVVAIIIVIMVISVRRKENDQAEVSNEANVEEFVETLDDGTRLNTSTKLQEKKTIDGLELSEFQVTAKENQTELLGIITNISDTTKGNYLLNIDVFDREGNKLTTAQVYVPEIAPGESTPLISGVTFDYANAYDFTVSVVEE